MKKFNLLKWGFLCLFCMLTTMGWASNTFDFTQTDDVYCTFGAKISDGVYTINASEEGIFNTGSNDTFTTGNGKGDAAVINGNTYSYYMKLESATYFTITLPAEMTITILFNDTDNNSNSVTSAVFQIDGSDVTAEVNDVGNVIYTATLSEGNHVIQRKSTQYFIFYIGLSYTDNGDTTISEANWDWKNNIPSGIREIGYELSDGEVNAFSGTTDYIDSDVDGIQMYVDTNHDDGVDRKFKVNGDNVQINEGTILHVPVVTEGDVVTITRYPNWFDCTIGSDAEDATFTDNVCTYEANELDVNKYGYVEIVSKGSYLYSVKVEYVNAMTADEIAENISSDLSTEKNADYVIGSNEGGDTENETVIVEECLYSTDFTEWDASASTNTVTTDYSNESLVFTLTKSDAMPDDVSNTEKFGDYEGCLRVNNSRDGAGEVTTSALKSITKVEVRYGTTGSNRGLDVYAKGDGDEDWVQVLSGLQSKNGSYTETIDVDRENCELKFVSADDANYVFLISLNIYGNVEEVIDLSDANDALKFTPSDSVTISSLSSIEIDVLGDSLYLPMALNSADALGKIVVTDESGNIQVGVETDEYDYCKYSYKQGETLNDDGETTTISDIGIIIPLAETIVAAGTYTYTIPENLIYWIDEDGNTIYNAEQTIIFTIDGTLEPGTFTISVSPDDEYVEELTELVVTIEGEGITLNEDLLSEIDIYARRVTTQPDATMSDTSSEVVDGNTVYTLTLATPVTDINTYQYTIPAGLFTDSEGNTSEEYVGFTYVTGPAVVHEYSAEPEDGSIVETLESITIICEDGMWWSNNYVITATKDGEEYELNITDDDLVEGDDDGANGDPSRMTIILNITEAGEYVITIPEGYFIVGSGADNSEEIILNYTVTGGETTGINSATLQATGDGKVYNLNGQRVSTPHNGIYFLNGKKVLVK